MYSSDYDEDWPENAVQSGAYAGDTTRSLALLFAKAYLTAKEVLRCPSTDLQPQLWDDATGLAATNIEDADDVSTSYMYDSRCNPRANPMKAMAADELDELDTDANNESTTNNHDNGINILYYDGHVEWQNAIQNFYTFDQNVLTDTGDTAGGTVDPDFSFSWCRKS
jgi:prepilin-type processing-associated H-X9-DG protein